MTDAEFRERHRAATTTDRWRELGREVRRRAGSRCENCGASGERLDAHHRHYRTLGRETAADLKALCRRCHWQEHHPGQDWFRHAEAEMMRWINSPGM